MPNGDRQGGLLPVGDGHVLYYECHGPANGIPFLLLHGGPGSGINSDMVALFASHPVRLIAFDQRGAGRSTPHGVDPCNTTAHLVADIEALRRHLDIDTWHVAGASWGSTLALCYAVQHASRCRGLMLASLFLGRRRDQEQTFTNALSFYPDVYAKAISGMSDDITQPERIGHVIYERLLSDDLETRRNAAYRFGCLSAPLVRLSPRVVEPDAIDDDAINKATLLLHYAAHDFFLPDDYILRHADALRDMPMWLLHGRLDLDCLPTQAWELKTALPHLDLRFAQGSHSLAEEPMHSAFSVLISDVMAHIAATQD